MQRLEHRHQLRRGRLAHRPFERYDEAALRRRRRDFALGRRLSLGGSGGGCQLFRGRTLGRCKARRVLEAKGAERLLGAIVARVHLRRRRHRVVLVVVLELRVPRECVRGRLGRRLHHAHRLVAVAKSLVELDAPHEEARREERQHPLHAQRAPAECLDRLSRALRPHQPGAHAVCQTRAVEHQPVERLVLGAGRHPHAHTPKELAHRGRRCGVRHRRVALVEQREAALDGAKLGEHAQPNGAHPLGLEFGRAEDRREALAERELVVAERRDDPARLHESLLVHAKLQLEPVGREQLEQRGSDRGPELRRARCGGVFELPEHLLEVRGRIEARLLLGHFSCG